jgi:transposase-like protein
VLTPGYCPNDDCPSRALPSFRWRRRGTYTRACDQRVVQRFLCLHCKRHFSTQSFRLDYRLKLPELHFVLIRDFVSKITHRQSARTLGCTRRTVHHRRQLLGRHCLEFHEEVLARAEKAGICGTRFLLDELETFEERRRLQPVTVPVVVEHPSYYVVGASVGTLPARGNLRLGERLRKAKLESLHGRRLNGSREAVSEALGFVRPLLGASGHGLVESDFKSTYPQLIRKTLGKSVAHKQHSSTAKRNRGNPLFPINHTLAMLRDGLSRLVRRSWAASKRRARLLEHLWIWIAWRNYVRPITNRVRHITPAMALGVLGIQHSAVSLTTWRVAPARR